MRAKRSVCFGLVFLLGLLAAVPFNSALANDTANTLGFRKAVTLKGIREHQAAFQAHSDANGGSRVAGSAAYEASANYVVQKMQAAGYQVSSQYFQFPFAGDRTPPVFQQITPSAVTYVDGVDFGTMQYSGSGDVTGPLVAVDLVLPPPPGPGNANTSGCEAADFAGFPAGAIALLRNQNQHSILPLDSRSLLHIELLSSHPN